MAEGWVLEPGPKAAEISAWSAVWISGCRESSYRAQESVLDTCGDRGEALEVLRLGTQHRGQDMRQSGPQEVLSQAGLEAHSGFPAAGKQPRDGGG